MFPSQIGILMSPTDCVDNIVQLLSNSEPLVILSAYILQAELKKLNYEEGREESLTASRRKLAEEVQHLREKVETMEARSV